MMAITKTGCITRRIDIDEGFWCKLSRRKHDGSI